MVERHVYTTDQQRNLSKANFRGYVEYATGVENGILHFAYYELVTLIAGNLSGIIGMGLRALLYPHLFKRANHKLAIGKGTIIRRPKNITIGKRCLIDDYAVLDVRGHGQIELGACVSVGRGSAIVCKGGKISLGDGVNIGTNCRIATTGNLTIGEGVLIAAYSYIGPGNHEIGDRQRPTIVRGMEQAKGVNIQRFAWIGARATVLDGVTIGEGAVIGAHSLVKSDVEPYTIVAGSPCRVIGRVENG